MKTTGWIEFGVAMVFWCWCVVTARAAVRKTVYTSAQPLCGDSYAEAKLDSTYKTTHASSRSHCAHMCYMESRCVSFNMDDSRQRCELNDEDFVCADLEAPASGYIVFHEGPTIVFATQAPPANGVTTQAATTDMVTTQEATSVAVSTAANPGSFTYTIIPTAPYAIVRENCIDQGGLLANLADQTVYEDAIAILEAMPTGAYGDRLWIGAEDLDEDGTWLWNDGTELTSAYPNFQQAVNSWPPSVQDLRCAMLWSQRDNNFGQVTVFQCDNYKEGLCQKPTP